MTREFKIAKLICETKNKAKLTEIFGTDDTTVILEQGMDNIIADIETEYDARTKEFSYGEIVLIGHDSKPAIFISKNGFKQSRVLLSTKCVNVANDDIRSTGRILWLDELNNEYDSDGLPITSIDEPRLKLEEKLEQLLQM